MFRPREFSTRNLLMVFVLSHFAIGANVGFKAAVTYAVGTNPIAAAAGDFNGDGKIDLAVVDSGNANVGDNGGVSILLGNGDGTFRPAVSIAAGKNPTFVSVGDFNGDNRLDLVVVNADNGGNVGILLGNGDGTFQSTVDYATGNGPSTVAVADFNGDHKPDLVVSNSTTLSLFLGNGDGTFQSRVDYEAGGTAIAVADFNGDGNADLALSAGARGVAILLGNGDGTFQPPSYYDGGSFFDVRSSIAPGDFNGDGRLDVLVSWRRFNGESFTYGCDLLVGNGDGTFQVTSDVVQTGLGSLYQADFNGDRKMDLVEPTGVELSVWSGNGDGTFQSPALFAVGLSSSGILGPPGQVVTSDLNGDKSPDIVVTNNTDDTISVLVNMVSTDFSISASAAGPGIVKPGQSTTSTISLSRLNAFDNPVSLACSVEPAQADSPTCSLNTPSVTFDASGKATALLTVLAGGSQTSQSDYGRSHPFGLLWISAVGLAFMGVRAGSQRSNQGKLFSLCVGCFLLAGSILQSGCGGGAGSGNLQSYTITVTGVSASTQHSTTLTLTVQ